jgi:hypothetical protein
LPLTSGVTGVLPVANGGTATSTAFTLGSVVFAGASGVYSQKNASFFWDNTNNRLGIGTTTPAVSLAISGTDAILLPVGTTGQQPTGATGMLRFNSSTTSFEGYNGSAWGSIGGGTPGGSTTQVQYNNAGALAGSSNLTFDGTNLTSGGTLVMGSSFKRNILINGNFLINQRVYVSGTATASGTYMHDRWKSTTTSSNYTFTQGTPDTTITIAAGTIAQIVENVNVAGGVYTLSWTGTATARIAINGASTSGSYAASPITTSSATAGLQITVEFSTGTCGLVQLEPGAKATPYERQIYSDQLSQCQRYYEKSYDIGTTPGSVTGVGQGQFYVSGVTGLNSGSILFIYKVTKRTTPTNTYYSPNTGSSGVIRDAVSNVDISAVQQTSGSSQASVSGVVTPSSGYINLLGQWTSSAEL